MRAWRKAKKEFGDEVKKKVKEKQEIEDRHPKVEVLPETKTLNLSPTEPTPIRRGDVMNINPIQQAINRLREKTQGL